MENMDKGLTHSKSADISTENIPNAPKFICPICLPKPKSLGFHWKKASLGVRSPCLQDSFDAVCQIQQWYFYNSRKTWSL